MSSEEKDLFDWLYAIILERKHNLPPDSYVASLYQKGEDKILKKVAEEAGEVIIASKNKTETEIIWEMADLWFHSLLVLGWHEIPPSKVLAELKKRHSASKSQK